MRGPAGRRAARGDRPYGDGRPGDEDEQPGDGDGPGDEDEQPGDGDGPGGEDGRPGDTASCPAGLAGGTSVVISGIGCLRGCRGRDRWGRDR
jgi:hypothetical protein